MASKTPYKFTHKRGTMVRVEVRKRGFDPYYEELEPDGDKTLNIQLDKAGRGGSTPKKKPGDVGKKTAPGPGATTPPGPAPVKKDPGNLPTGLRDPFSKGK